MTDTVLPTGSQGAEGDGEERKGGADRQHLETVISKTLFNGAIERLIAGTVEAKSLVTVLDELNRLGPKGRYMAEMLALKKESRGLATAPFSPHVADFLLQSSRRIPTLSAGLASQMAVTLAAAAENLAYIDTVNTAIGNLLFDVEHPLLPDTRNYLRALTDRIDATRRLQEARAYLPIMPSVYPLPAPLSTPAPSLAAPDTSLQSPSTETVEALAPESLPVPPPVTLPPAVPGASAPVGLAEALPVLPAGSPESPPTIRGLGESVPGPVTEGESTGDRPPTIRSLGESVPRGAAVPSAASKSAFRGEEAPPAIPTGASPRKLGWVLLGAATAVGLGAYLWFGRSRSDSPEATPTATEGEKAPPSGVASAASGVGKPDPRNTEAIAKPRASEPRQVEPAPPVTGTNLAGSRPTGTRSVASRPVERRPVERRPVGTGSAVTKPVESSPHRANSTATKPVESGSDGTKSAGTNPRASATSETPRMSAETRDVDQILEELRQIPDSEARINAKAREVSRIVARSARPEAEKLLARLTPEELLHGTESVDTRALDPRRRVVALLLAMVALDKDDARAVTAIELLGEWAKSRIHGGAAKLTLDQLAQDPVLQSRNRRRQALQRVQQALKSANQGRE